MTLLGSLTPSIISSMTPSLLLGIPSFVSTWKTDNTGTSNDNQISLPTEPSGTYNFNVSWGDGESELITAWDQAETTHTYSVAGTYTVTISGLINGWRFNGVGDKDKIINISSWGTLLLGNNGDYFFFCGNLTITATDILNTSGMTKFESMFERCNSVATIPNITQWDMSSATQLNKMFANNTAFNQNLNGWDTSNVNNFSGMFRSCTLFAGSVSAWDTSSADNMFEMFLNTNFNGDVSGFDTSNVTTMQKMFRTANLFDQDVSNFDVSNLTNATEMFNISGFTQPNYDLLLVAWEAQAVQNNVNFNAGTAQFGAGAPATARAALIADHNWTITDGGPAFTSLWKTDNTGTSNDNQISLPTEPSGTYNFNVSWGDGESELITAWDQAETTHTYSVAGTYTVTISGLINGWRFNNTGDKEKIIEISSWGTLLLGNSGRYFDGAFNLIITATDILDTSAMTNFDLIFQFCSSITTIPSINQWDVSNVTIMDGAFNGASLFNSFIGDWDVSSVIDMPVMFFNATSFDQDISNWDVSNLEDAIVMFQNSGFSITNYDLLLVAWDQLTLQNNVNFHAGSAQYSAGAPATARANIISNFIWSITDGGQA